MTCCHLSRQTELVITSRTIPGILLAVHAMCFCTTTMAQTSFYTVLRSQDKGRTWAPSDAGLRSDGRINAFGVTADGVLAGTDRGIYLSRDRGLSWRPATGGGVRRILSFTTIGASAYAGADSDTLLVSKDGGSSWTARTGLPFRKVRALLEQDGALYAGTDAGGVFVSRDGGQSWASISHGLPANAQIFGMVSLKGRIFAGLYSKGLWVLARQGASWRKVDSVTPLVLAITGETLLAGHNPGGIFRSDDAGQTWGKSEIPEDPGKAPVWEMGTGPDLALAGVSSRIYYSDNRGRSWAAARTGIPDGSSGISFLVGEGFALAGVVVRQDRADK